MNFHRLKIIIAIIMALAFFNPCLMRSYAASYGNDLSVDSYNSLEHILSNFNYMHNYNEDTKPVKVGNTDSQQDANDIRRTATIFSIWDCDKDKYHCEGISQDPAMPDRNQCKRVTKKAVDDTIQEYFGIDAARYKSMNTIIRAEPDAFMPFSFDGRYYHFCDNYGDDPPGELRVDKATILQGGLVNVKGRVSIDELSSGLGNFEAFFRMEPGEYGTKFKFIELRFFK